MLDQDLTYLLEVLNIADGETEEALDERLRAEAKELGLEVAEEKHVVQENRHLKAYQSDYARRSDSIDSRASQTTSLTSNYSDFCRDHAQSFEQRRASRASLSFRDYDAFLARGVPNGRNSISFSPLTTPANSTFSLPLSQPSSPDSSSKKHFRRIRGLSMLRLHNHSRAGSDAAPAETCPHCPPDSTSQRRAVHRLPCGHRLCTQALRNTVKMATDSKTGAVPSCCGRPIPGSLVENIMTREEQNVLLDKLGQWDEAISIAPSIDSSRRDSITSVAVHRPGRLTAQSRTVSEESRISSLSPRQRKEADEMMAREDYRLLHKGQSDQRDRFLRWFEKRRSQLERKHEELRESLKCQHETAADDMAEQHASAMSEAEDKQVKAEADMRKTQEQEKADNATALKHMEAYCAGTYGSGEAHNRTVTEQDLSELDKARRTRDQMDSRHESQVNVLRGEQYRRMRLRAQRQEREMQEMRRQQRKEELETVRTCSQEVLLLEESAESRRRRIRWRWEVQMAILTHKAESETGTGTGTGVHLDFRLPTAEWPRRGRDRDSLPMSPRTTTDLHVDAHANADVHSKLGVSSEEHSTIAA